MVRRVRARVAPSWATPSKVGQPDHQTIVYAGSVTDRIVLNADEAVIRLGLLMNAVPSPYPHYMVPLPSGATYNVVDLGTGVVTPWICPVGFTFTILSYWWGFNQPCNGTMYMDGFLLSSLDEDAYRSHYEHDIFEDYNPLDPTGILPHTVDFQLTNMGTVDMSGYYMCIIKLREAGTDPYPDDKEVKCRCCGHMWRIDRKLGPADCPKCGKKNIYFPFVFGREIYK